MALVFLMPIAPDTKNLTINLRDSEYEEIVEAAATARKKPSAIAKELLLDGLMSNSLSEENRISPLIMLQLINITSLLQSLRQMPEIADEPEFMSHLNEAVIRMRKTFYSEKRGTDTNINPDDREIQQLLGNDQSPTLKIMVEEIRGLSNRIEKLERAVAAKG